MIGGETVHPHDSGLFRKERRMNMKQNNYQKLAAVYTGIALADLIAVFCVLRRLPDPEEPVHGGPVLPAPGGL